MVSIDADHATAAIAKAVQPLKTLLLNTTGGLVDNKKKVSLFVLEYILKYFVLCLQSSSSMLQSCAFVVSVHLYPLYYVCTFPDSQCSMFPLLHVSVLVNLSAFLSLYMLHTV